MAASEVAICNVALARIGHSAPISALDEASTEAAMCKVLYAAARDTVLAAAPWPFATKWAELAPLAAESAPLSPGWAHAFETPADCLRVVRVWGGRVMERADQAVAFAVEFGTTRKLIRANDAGITVEYVARIENPQAFDPGFENALAWNLGADLAVALAKDDAREDRARRNYELSLSRAITDSLSEPRRNPEPDGSPFGSRW